ncbi:MAG: hypothetical protein IJ730_06780 [Alphaproteobacteria bacterium]|nr:hypothetical protein [Alphaproteobacteria bacterium]
MKKTFVAVAIFCIGSVFSMEQNMQLVLRNQISASKTETLSIVREPEFLTEFLTEPQIQKIEPQAQSSQETESQKIRSIIRKGKQEGKGLKQLVEEGKLQIKHRDFSIGPIIHNVVRVFFYNSVVEQENTDFEYLEFHDFPLVREGSPKNYIVKNEDIDPKSKTAKLIPVYDAIAEVDDKFLEVNYQGYQIINNRLILEDEYFVYSEGTVNITNIDDAFCEEWLDLEGKYNIAIENHEWKKAGTFIGMQEELKKRLVDIARERGLLSALENINTGESYSEQGRRRYEKFEEWHRPKETFVHERAKRWKTFDKPKPDAPIIPTRWLMLEMPGANQAEIINTIYKTSFDRMRNEFKWLVAPTWKKWHKNLRLFL